MRIAICDDDRDEIEKLKHIISEIQGNYQMDFFENGKAMLEAAAQGDKYDIAFCDIYMKNENGMDTAKEMQALSPETAIVFITSSTEHAVEAFSIQALHYLVKPVSAEDIVEVFRRFGVKREPRHTLTLRIERNVTVLFQDEIIRVEGQRHRTLIISAEDTVFSIWKPYGQISSLLDDTFLHIKKGVSVNMRYISQMSVQKCVMKDGCIFLLSRNTARSNYERYCRYLEESMENPS